MSDIIRIKRFFQRAAADEIMARIALARAQTLLCLPRAMSFKVI
jgi:hypothetical protein